MTTYATGNPVPSADLLDLYDNAENFDTALHTTNPTWTDRLGITRVSIGGAAAAAEAARDAAVVAQNNAVAVVTGGTGSLTAAPGKLPLADSSGNLHVSWVGQITRSPEMYGAIGDGVADDTAALRALISACGVGGAIHLTAGKTYAVSGTLTLLAGQTVYGYGASLKRCNEIKSATSSAIVTGVTPSAVAVADGSIFSVGSDVTVYSGSSYDPNTHRIIGISGNILTVGTDFTVAFPSGGNVITCGPLLKAAAGKAMVLGLEIDGNRANNASLAKWELYAGVYVSGDGATVRDCYIHDAVVEAIYVGGDGCSAENNVIKNCGGNGIHFSGSSGGKADKNYIENVNILGVAPGHADGGILFSNSTEDAFITNNYIDTAICGVGSIDHASNGSVVISGNIIKNCTTTAIEGITPSGDTVSRVVVSNNLIYNSVAVNFNYPIAANDSVGPQRLIVCGNCFEYTDIAFTRVNGAIIEGNIFNAKDNTTNSIISIIDTKNLHLQNNWVVGGGRAVYASGTASASNKISGNTFTNQYARAIHFDAASTKATTIEQNTIVVDGGYATNGYYGITTTNGCAVVNNVMDISVTSGNSAILCPPGGSGINGAFVQGNVIRSTGLTYAIRASGGSQNNIIINNMTQQTVSNGGGASNTVTGNVVIV